MDYICRVYRLFYHDIVKCLIPIGQCKQIRGVYFSIYWRLISEPLHSRMDMSNTFTLTPSLNKHGCFNIFQKTTTFKRICAGLS